jgi:uncharacterized protein (TIGR02145 family)
MFRESVSMQNLRLFILTAILMGILTALCMAQTIDRHGIVTDTGGVPISGAIVRLQTYGHSDTTDSEGNFFLSGSGTDISYNANKPALSQFSAVITNGMLTIKLAEKANIEIVSYDLKGKAVLSIHQTVSAGAHSIKLPYNSSGIYLNRIKYNDNELILKSNTVSGSSKKADDFVKIQNITAKKASQTLVGDTFDVLIVKKEGFLNYYGDVLVKYSDLARVKMIPCASPAFTDIDNNVYQTVQIGNRVWTIENLRVTKYNDGTPIEHDTNATTWANAKTPKYCFYENTTNQDSIEKYGALYNWHVVNTGKLAPKGWRVPDTTDWNYLDNYLIDNGYSHSIRPGNYDIAQSLASKIGWDGSSEDYDVGNNTTYNNTSGFSAYPTGSCDDLGGFSFKGYACFFWSATNEDSVEAHGYALYADDSMLWWFYLEKPRGLAVRLVKDL